MFNRRQPRILERRLTAPGLGLRPAGVRVANQFRSIHKLEPLQAGRQHAVDTADFFQSSRPGVENFDRLGCVRLPAGNRPHQRILVCPHGIFLRLTGVDVRCTAPFLDRPAHSVIGLGVRTLGQHLEAVVDRPFPLGHPSLHPGDILPTMQQPRVNEPLRSRTNRDKPQGQHRPQKTRNHRRRLSGLPRLVSSRLSSHANYTLFKIRVAN